MSAAIAAISKLAAVKTSSIAHRTPLFTPIPELKFSHQKIGIKQEDDKAYFDDRPPDILVHGTNHPLGHFHMITPEKLFGVTWSGKLEPLSIPAVRISAIGDAYLQK